MEKICSKTRSSLDYYKRSDVVFKIILRHFRRIYLKLFQQKTAFSHMQKYRPPIYYLSCLTKLIDSELSMKFEGLRNSCQQEQVLELKFFIGSMLYPKKLAHLLRNKRISAQIQKIHTSLQSFTRSKLNFLLRFPAFRLLLNHFRLNYLESSLKENPTMSKAAEDYRVGYSYIFNMIDTRDKGEKVVFLS